jgi:hypothetical protein
MLGKFKPRRSYRDIGVLKPGLRLFLQTVGAKSQLSEELIPPTLILSDPYPKPKQVNGLDLLPWTRI